MTFDFAGNDFAGSDFAGSDFAGSDFAGSDFAGSDFASRDFIPERTTILFSMFMFIYVINVCLCIYFCMLVEGMESKISNNDIVGIKIKRLTLTS